MNKDNELTLVEKLRQASKWYNLSNSYAHNLLLEAAKEIERLENEVEFLYEIQNGEDI